MSQTKRKIWAGNGEPSCDIHKHSALGERPIPKGEFFVDGKTFQGPWALMCEYCFIRYGVGLGTGRGQQYKYNDSVAAWVKVAG